MVSLDPSMGTGGDYAAIQVFELPTFEQVGEWHHNTTPMNQQVRILQGITKHLHDSIMEKDAYGNTSNILLNGEQLHRRSGTVEGNGHR